MVRPIADLDDYVERIKGCLSIEYGLHPNLDFDSLVESYMDNIRDFYNGGDTPTPEDAAHWIYEEENGSQDTWA